jgi:hypothetical protein
MIEAYPADPPKRDLCRTAKAEKYAELRQASENVLASAASITCCTHLLKQLEKIDHHYLSLTRDLRI